MKRIWVKFKLWCLKFVIKWLDKIKNNHTFNNQDIEKVIDENLETIITKLEKIYSKLYLVIHGHNTLGKK